MIKYRIVYIGDNMYLAWDADSQWFVPAHIHLYVSTWDNLEECMKEMRNVKREYPGWADSIYIDTIPA